MFRRQLDVRFNWSPLPDLLYEGPCDRFRVFFIADGNNYTSRKVAEGSRSTSAAGIGRQQRFQLLHKSCRVRF